MPPSVVLSNTLKSWSQKGSVHPATLPVLASVKETATKAMAPYEWNAPVTFLYCSVHVAPPSVVRRIEKSPTAVPVLSSANATTTRKDSVALDCGVHVDPPSAAGGVCRPPATRIPTYA